MDRRRFLQVLGIGAAAITVASPALATLAAPNLSAKFLRGDGTWASSEEITDELHRAIVDAYMHTSKWNEMEVMDDITLRKYQAALHDTVQPFRDRRSIYDFKVICDDSNNPPLYIQRASVPRLDVWIKPTRQVVIKRIRIHEEVGV